MKDCKKKKQMKNKNECKGWGGVCMASSVSRLRSYASNMKKKKKKKRRKNIKKKKKKQKGGRGGGGGMYGPKCFGFRQITSKPKKKKKKKTVLKPQKKRF